MWLKYDEIWNAMWGKCLCCCLCCDMPVWKCSCCFYFIKRVARTEIMLNILVVVFLFAFFFRVLFVIPFAAHVWLCEIKQIYICVCVHCGTDMTDKTMDWRGLKSENAKLILVHWSWNYIFYYYWLCREGLLL